MNIAVTLHRFVHLGAAVDLSASTCDFLKWSEPHGVVSADLAFGVVPPGGLSIIDLVAALRDGRHASEQDSLSAIAGSRVTIDRTSGQLQVASFKLLLWSLPCHRPNVSGSR